MKSIWKIESTTTILTTWSQQGKKKEIVAKNILINYSMRKTIMDQPFILLDMFKKSW